MRKNKSLIFPKESSLNQVLLYKLGLMYKFSTNREFKNALSAAENWARLVL